LFDVDRIHGLGAEALQGWEGKEHVRRADDGRGKTPGLQSPREDRWGLPDRDLHRSGPDGDLPGLIIPWDASETWRLVAGQCNRPVGPLYILAATSCPSRRTSPTRSSRSW